MHEPVLLREVLDYLAPKAGESYLDATAGWGGHAQKILELTENYQQSILIDRDAQAFKQLNKTFASSGAQIIQSGFLSASRQLYDEKRQFDLILADLGVSSPHLNQASRGFSFRMDGPLDMRMDQTQELTADEVVNRYSEKKLVNILRDYGQEPKALEIARRIVDERPVSSTKELAEIVQKSWPGHSRVHPATRTFQALRIEVNSELEQLEKSLPIWAEMLKSGGRLVVVSFHSLEDHIVKDFFAENSRKGYDTKLKLLTKKPITASPEEIAFNPRARSAKLRAAAKIKTKRKD